LAARTPRQRWHITFHESGERHWRFDSAEELARAGGPSLGRDADSWMAPDPVAGLAKEFVLLVPTSELRVPAARRRTDGVQWLDPAPAGEALRIAIGRRLVGGPSVSAVWTAPLTSGDDVVVVTDVGPLSREESDLLDRTKARLAAQAADGRSLADPAGFSWGHAGDRTRFWIAVAAE
jgi:hypothetical protein